MVKKSNDKVIFMDINDSDSKKIAKVVNSSTAKKILEYVENNPDITESEIAKSLELAVSTVHFNVDNLIKAGMLESSEYHYSEKGRQVDHLKVSNKLIVFTHKKVDDSIKQKIMSLVLSICFAFVFFSSTITSYLRFASNKVVSSISSKMAYDSEPVLDTMVSNEAFNDSARILMKSSPNEEIMGASEALMMDAADYTVEPVMNDLVQNSTIFDLQSFILGLVVGISLILMIYFIVKLIRQVKRK